VIAVSRSLQEIVIAIIFVVMVGFGPLAGVLTLAFASIGFLGKLLAEDIEDIEPTQLEAIQTTGGPWFQSMAFGLVPQTMPRFVGLSVYRLDINFRESAVIGIVGAGGIGGALNTSISRYEYGTTAAIILVIVALVYAGEFLSGIVRAGVQ
jgi:phosphonate transport system permease protein